MKWAASPDIVEEVTRTNQLILSLSPVLKSPAYSGLYP